MKHINDVPVKEVTPGISGRYVHGSLCTMGYVQLTPGAFIGLHNHPHEQITFMIEGEMQMQIGSETVVLTPGSVRVIPSGTMHSAKAHTNCIVIDVFAPVREDYRQ